MGSFQLQHESEFIMTLLDTRKSVRVHNQAFAAAVIALGAGCTGRVYAGPGNVESAPVVAGTAEDDGEVIYVQGPPVVEIDTYPSVFYGGVNVYYVDGLWYHQGPRGWSYYRQEPPELGRQREDHYGRDHDGRWADPRAAPQRVPPPAQRPGVAEVQPPDRRAPPAETRREGAPAATYAPAAQPRREGPPATSAPKAQPRGRDEMGKPRAAPRRVAPLKGAPASERR